MERPPQARLQASSGPTSLPLRARPKRACLRRSTSELKLDQRAHRARLSSPLSSPIELPLELAPLSSTSYPIELPISSTNKLLKRAPPCELAQGELTHESSPYVGSGHVSSPPCELIPHMPALCFLTPLKFEVQFHELTPCELLILIL